MTIDQILIISLYMNFFPGETSHISVFSFKDQVNNFA